MTPTHRSDPGPMFDARVRAVLRAESDVVEMERALGVRGDGKVRLYLPKIVWEVYDDVPDETPVHYLPGEHALVVDLPGPNHQGDRA